MIGEYQSARKAVNAAACSARLLVTFIAFLCLSGFDRPDPSREEIVIPTNDGVHLSAHLYRPDLPAAEGALLIHGEGDSKERFAVLARHLRDRGVVVLVVDLRGHGQSQTRSKFGGETVEATADRRSYPRDLEAAFSRLRTEILPEADVLLGGMVEGAHLAVEAASWVGKQEFSPSLCLIRPGTEVLRPLLDDEAVTPTVVLVGRDDIAARQVARDLYGLGSEAREVWQLDGGPTIYGTMILRDDFCADLAAWFVNTAESRRLERRRAEATTSIESR